MLFNTILDKWIFKWAFIATHHEVSSSLTNCLLDERLHNFIKNCLKEAGKLAFLGRVVWIVI